jgi:integrase
VSQRSFERYEQLVRLHISPEIGMSKLRDLSPTHLRAFYRKKLDEIDPS